MNDEYYKDYSFKKILLKFYKLKKFNADTEKLKFKKFNNKKTNALEDRARFGVSKKVLFNRVWELSRVVAGRSVSGPKKKEVRY